MEPFDAILENLERAQRRGMEAVSNRLDFVIETLQDLVRDARTSVQEAIPGDAEELFPLAEAREAVRRAEEAARSWAEEAERLRARVEELESRPAAPAGPSLGLLRQLDAARSQKELLHALLPVLKRYAGRAVVLVLREGRASAWSGIGLTDAERLRLWNGDAAASPALDRLASEGVACRFAPAADPVFSTWLAGEPVADEALLVPVALRGRVVGGIYLDRVPGEPWDPETAQSLVALACWLIDTLPHRPQAPSPPLTEPVAVGEAQPETEPTPAAQPAVEPAEPREAAVAGQEPEEAVAVPVAPAEPAAAAAAPEVAPEEAAPASAEAEEPPAEAPVAAPEPAEAPSEAEGEAGAVEPEAPAYDPSATMRVDMAGPAVEPPKVEPVTPPPQQPEPEAPAGEEAGIPPELQPAHEEARRFARLLVSEIKLYNEDEVERGRQAGDIYQRLKEDIDRSREMYEQRVPEEVRRVRDYFHEELVRILADGNPDLLGM